MKINHGYKAEIPSKIIFEQMKKYSYNFFKKNKKININSKIKGYFQRRNSIIYLIKRISDKLCFKSQTFFLSLYYLDIIKLECIDKSENNSLFNNMASLALSCLVIAAKYCENDPNVPQLTFFIKVYNSVVDIRYQNTIALSDLIYNEIKICKILKYQLHYYTIYDYNSFLFGHGILKLEQIKEIKDNSDNNIPFSIYAKKILEKIYRKSRIYLDIIINKKVCMKYSSLLLSIYIMQKSVESVIINESTISRNIEKHEFKNRSYKYFKEIMHGFYEINYDSMEEYQLMKKEIESKNRNKNLFQKTNIINCNISLEKTNYNNYGTSNILNSYKKNNDYILDNYNNGEIYLNEDKIRKNENEFLFKLKEDNINNNRENNNNIEIFNNIKSKINYDEKKAFSSKKISKIESLNNSNYFSKTGKNICFYNNNYSNILASSVNLNNFKYNFYKENTSKNKDETEKKEKDSFITKQKSNNMINITKKGNKMKNRDFMSFHTNISTKLNLTNVNQLMNISKLYYKKILYKNIKNKKKFFSNKIHNKTKKLKEINNINPLHINLNNKLGLINIKNNTNINNFDINDNYLSNKNERKKKDTINNKERNVSEFKIKKMNLLYNREYPTLKTESFNYISNSNSNLDSYIGKFKHSLKTKKNKLNLYHLEEFYSKTDINQSLISSSLKNNIIRDISKEVSKNKKRSKLEKKKYMINNKNSKTKINDLKEKNIKKREKPYQEYNIITFLEKDVNNNNNKNKNNKDINKMKNYYLTASNHKNQINKNNIIINNKLNNKNLYSTIIINNNFNINFNKKSNSKENAKNNYKKKYENNTLSFCRNNKNEYNKHTIKFTKK